MISTNLPTGSATNSRSKAFSEKKNQQVPHYVPSSETSPTCPTPSKPSDSAETCPNPKRRRMSSIPVVGMSHEGKPVTRSSSSSHIILGDHFVRSSGKRPRTPRSILDNPTSATSIRVQAEISARRSLRERRSTKKSLSFGTPDAENQSKKCDGSPDQTGETVGRSNCAERKTFVKSRNGSVMKSEEEVKRKIDF